MGSATPTVACCTHLHSLFARVEQRLLQCQISRRLVALPMLKNLPHTRTHTLYTLSLPLSLSLSFPLPSPLGLRHVCAKQTVCHRDEQTPELIGQKQKLLCLDWIDNDSSLVAQLPGCIPLSPPSSHSFAAALTESLIGSIINLICTIQREALVTHTPSMFSLWIHNRI